MKKKTIIFSIMIGVAIIVILVAVPNEKNTNEVAPQNEEPVKRPVFYVGNYHRAQPGLTSILNQMPEEVGHLEIAKPFDHALSVHLGNVYPVLFNLPLTDDAYNQLGDTLKYNWAMDTIVCHISYDCVYNDTFSELISSCDTIRLYTDLIDYIISHNYSVNSNFDKKYKKRFVDLLKQWDQEKIDSVFRTSQIHGSVGHNISRYTICNGKLVDVKYKKGILGIEYDKL